MSADSGTHKKPIKPHVHRTNPKTDKAGRTKSADSYRDEGGAPLRIAGKHVCARGSCTNDPGCPTARYCASCQEIENKPTPLELGRRRPTEW